MRLRRCSRLVLERQREPFYKQRVAELVRPIVVLLRLRRHPRKHVILLKRAEEFIVARAALMHAGYDAVDNQQPRLRSDAARRHTASRPDVAPATCRVLERADDSRPERKDAAAALPGPVDERRGCRRNHVRLIERQQPIEIRISCRGDARRVRDARHAHVSSAQCPQHRPVEDKPGRWGFEGNRL